MVIGTNVASLTAQRHLANSRADMETSMERLSSGKRINSAMDDAAGLAIAHKLESKVTGLNQSVRNANDGISMVGVAEGALDEISNMLNRMKELSVQAVNDSYSAADRASVNTEFTALRDEIERISTTTDYNGVSILNSSTAITIQVGDASGDTISITPQDMGKASIGGGADTVNDTSSVATTALGVSTHTTGAAMASGKSYKITIDGTELTQAFDTDASTTMTKMGVQILALSSVSAITAGDGSSGSTMAITATVGSSVGALQIVTPGGNIGSQTITTSALASTSITNIDAAIADVDSYRGALGAVASQLSHAVSNLMSRSEHQSSALSRIEDTDFAVESANLAKAQVLQQAGTAMLAQANASGQGVLSLLK
jgi:flagellin